MREAEQEVLSAFPKRPEGEASWTLAELADGGVDAYALGRFHGSDGDVFLVIGDGE